MKLRIIVDGKVYEVEVEIYEPEPPHPGYVPAPGQVRVQAGPPGAVPPVRPTTTSVADESKVCRSPVVGVVVRIAAQAGQAIQINDPILVLEAMKMETVITSPRAGKVIKVNVNAGEAVQAGQVLVEFE